MRPGVLLTKASRRWLVSALSALDLPALERPTKAISGAEGGGNFLGSCTESTYRQLAKRSAVLTGQSADWRRAMALR